MTIKKILLFLVFANIGYSHMADAHSPDNEIKKLKWSFEGVLGHYDRAAIQRGFQVYNEVCAACHSMNLLTYRKLKDVGFSEEEVKAIAATKTIHDGPNDDGDMFDRPGKPTDKFASPYPNKNAAMAANNGAYPKDLSLIVKADKNGANYIYSLLTGYIETPDNFELPDGKYYNEYFVGHTISMPPPLPSEGMVTYIDETDSSIDQMSRDVSYFLQWASEPELEERKKMGINFMIFLSIATIICYLLKKRIWRDVK